MTTAKQRFRADPAVVDPTAAEKPRSLTQRERERLRETSDVARQIAEKVINPDGTFIGDASVVLLVEIATDLRVIREFIEQMPGMCFTVTSKPEGGE